MRLTRNAATNADLVVRRNAAVPPGVDNAVKIARVATGRSAVVAFTGAFHGRVLLRAGSQ